ncbi:bifunctional alpha/beta hydrolase/OsmC family protein [Amphiplicatus metriothermophilus]|uniref:Putative redox protein n=1 Tax=Amphiplicatus metriothermophilus TaxID=1519374 RepID=A0A239PP10_9PROT|nr:alpha/beta fold hydrolase [Amphiplicatus metriothermophilus]MBB5518804.1 putative redox protein [Amphiplicatus metriothermophilus]SNT72041.1 putative redox protein [Amphiplicatus metriothermophilus]
MPESTRKIEFDGSQDARLAAALELPSGKPRAFALFAHCFSCTKDIKAAREIARALRAEGFAVLRFDFTGLGASEGDFANTNFSSNVEDLLKAADFLRREFEAPSVVIGHSLGGAAAIVAATRIPETKGVAVIAAPAESAHVARHIEEKREEIEKNGYATVSLAGRPFTIKKQFLDDLDRDRVLAAAAALKKPMLVLHSPLDEIVGVENATKIFLAAKHPKSFVSLDRADHLLRDPRDARYAGAVIAAWASRYLPGVASDADESDRLEMRRADGLDGGEAVLIAERRYATAASAGGHKFVVDADEEDGGDGLGPNPTRLVEAALAACSAITLRMYAERKGWELETLKVTVKRAEGEGAHLARTLEKTVAAEGPELDEEKRARLLEIADRCPVNRMLADGVKIVSRLA